MQGFRDKDSRKASVSKSKAVVYLEKCPSVPLTTSPGQNPIDGANCHKLSLYENTVPGMTAKRLSQPPLTPPQCRSMSSLRGMLSSSSTVQGLFTWPLMQKSFVPVISRNVYSNSL